MGAQGDVLFRRVADMPEGVTEVKYRIVAHSETGHHHVAQGDLRLFKGSDPMVMFLSTQGSPIIEHMRDWDTHESIELLNESGGEVVWEIRRQREHTPEGWRMVMD